MSDKLKVTINTPVLKEGSQYIRRDGSISGNLVQLPGGYFKDPESGYLYDGNDPDFGNLVQAYYHDPSDLIFECKG